MASGLAALFVSLDGATVTVSGSGGAAVAALDRLAADGTIGAADSVVVFNTGAGWLYR